MRHKGENEGVSASMRRKMRCLCLSGTQFLVWDSIFLCWMLFSCSLGCGRFIRISMGHYLQDVGLDLRKMRRAHGAEFILDLIQGAKRQNKLPQVKDWIDHKITDLDDENG